MEANTMYIAVWDALGFRWAGSPSDSRSKVGGSSWCDPRITEGAHVEAQWYGKGWYRAVVLHKRDVSKSRGVEYTIEWDAEGWEEDGFPTQKVGAEAIRLARHPWQLQRLVKERKLALGLTGRREGEGRARRKGRQRLEEEEHEQQAALVPEHYPAKSGVKGAGEGLFAGADIEAGSVIVAMNEPQRRTPEEGQRYLDRCKCLPDDAVIYQERGRKWAWYDASWTAASSRPLWHYLNHAKPGVVLWR